VPRAGAHQDPGRRRHGRTVLGRGARLDVLEGQQPRDEEDPMTEYLDPTDSVAVPRKTAPRPSSLDGKVVTLLDISKAKGDHLLDRIEELLRERAAPKASVPKKKPTLARPAPAALRDEAGRATDVH